MQTNFFQQRLEVDAAVTITSHSLDKDLKLEADIVVDWSVPTILRLPIDFVCKFQGDLDECRNAFTDSSAKATSGRAYRICSKDRGFSP